MCDNCIAYEKLSRGECVWVGERNRRWVSFVIQRLMDARFAIFSPRMLARRFFHDWRAAQTGIFFAVSVTRMAPMPPDSALDKPPFLFGARQGVLRLSSSKHGKKAQCVPLIEPRGRTKSMLGNLRDSFSIAKRSLAFPTV